MNIDSPYAPPESPLIDQDTGGMFTKGRYVIFYPHQTWPDRCFKCNEATDFKKTTRITYINPWIYVSILVTILLTIILALIFRKRFTIELPLCQRHVTRRRNFLIFQWSMVALMVGAIAVGVLSSSDTLLALSALVFLVIVVSAIFGRLAYAARYRDEKIWLTGAGKEFRNSLPEMMG